MILGDYVYAQYSLFSLNIFRYLQFHALAINSQVAGSHQIVDFLGIFPIFSRFQKVVRFYGGAIRRFTMRRVDGWDWSVVALAERWARRSKPEVDSGRDYLKKKDISDIEDLL